MQEHQQTLRRYFDTGAHVHPVYFLVTGRTSESGHSKRHLLFPHELPTQLERSGCASSVQLLLEEHSSQLPDLDTE